PAAASRNPSADRRCSSRSTTRNRTSSYDGPDHVAITARADELNRAVTSLVENAVRYGTRVIVRLNETPSTVIIEVDDDGPGIIEAQRDLMIEPFARGDPARTMNETAGFGLGLSIARTIAEAHGGTLSLLDRSPSGLIARIELPRLA